MRSVWVNQRSYKDYVPYRVSLTTGSIVSVKLDMDKKEISFIINGIDCGVAFKNISIYKELCLCVILPNNSSIEIV